MSQLVIIDVQNRFLKTPGQVSDLCGALIEAAKAHGDLVFILDSHDGEEIDFPEELIEYDSEDEENYIFDPHSHPRFFKQYGFFRNLMDEGIEDEEIVNFGKWMMANNITDARDIEEDDRLSELYKKDFKNSVLINYDYDSHTFYIPMDLVDDIKNNIRSGCVLAGGGINECLKEISLLLDILDIDYSINYDITY